MRGEMPRCVSTRRCVQRRNVSDCWSRSSTGAPRGVERAHYWQRRAVAGGAGRACRQWRAHERPRQPRHASFTAVKPAEARRRSLLRLGRGCVSSQARVSLCGTRSLATGCQHACSLYAQRSPVCSGVSPRPPRPHALHGTLPNPCAGSVGSPGEYACAPCAESGWIAGLRCAGNIARARGACCHAPDSHSI